MGLPRGVLTPREGPFLFSCHTSEWASSLLLMRGKSTDADSVRVSLMR